MFRIPPKLQLLWSVSSLQWSASNKSDPRKKQWWTNNGGGWPKLTNARGQWRLDLVVQSNRLVTVAQIAEKVHTGSGRKVSEDTVHHSLLCMGLNSWRPFKAPVLTSVMNKAWSDESCFIPRRWPGAFIAYLGNTWHQEALWKESKPAEVLRRFGTIFSISIYLVALQAAWCNFEDKVWGLGGYSQWLELIRTAAKLLLHACLYFFFCLFISFMWASSCTTCFKSTESLVFM